MFISNIFVEHYRPELFIKSFSIYIYIYYGSVKYAQKDAFARRDIFEGRFTFALGVTFARDLNKLS